MKWQYFFIIAAIFVASCDALSKRKEDMIVGTWNASITQSTENGLLNGEITVSIKSNKSFSANMTVNGIPIKMTGSWEIQGDKYLVMKTTEHSLTELAPKDMTATSEILELNENTLILDEDDAGRVTYKKL